MANPIKCTYCKAKPDPVEEENFNDWGEDWPLVDPDDLTYYCANCDYQDKGWAMKAVKGDE